MAGLADSLKNKPVTGSPLPQEEPKSQQDLTTGAAVVKNTTTGQITNIYPTFKQAQEDFKVVYGGAESPDSLSAGDIITGIAIPAGLTGASLGGLLKASGPAGAIAGTLIGAMSGISNLQGQIDAANKRFLNDPERVTTSALEAMVDETTGKTVYKVNKDLLAKGNSLSGNMAKVYQSTPTETPVSWGEDGRLKVNVSTSFAESDIYKDALAEIKTNYAGLTKALDDAEDGAYLDELNKYIGGLQSQYQYAQQAAATYEQKFPSATTKGIEIAINNQKIGLVNTDQYDLEYEMQVPTEDGKLETMTAQKLFLEVKNMGGDKIKKDEFLGKFYAMVNDPTVNADIRAAAWGTLNALWGASRRENSKYSGMLQKEALDYVGENLYLFGESVNDIVGTLTLGNSYGELKYFYDNDFWDTVTSLGGAYTNLVSSLALMNGIEAGLRKIPGLSALSKIAPQSTPLFTVGQGVISFGFNAAADAVYELLKTGADVLGKRPASVETFWSNYLQDLCMDVVVTGAQSAALQLGLSSRGLSVATSDDVAKAITANSSMATIVDEAGRPVVVFNQNDIVKVEKSATDTGDATAPIKEVFAEPVSKATAVPTTNEITLVKNNEVGFNESLKQAVNTQLAEVVSKKGVRQVWSKVLDKNIALKELGFEATGVTGDEIYLVRVSELAQNTRALVDRQASDYFSGNTIKNTQAHWDNMTELANAVKGTNKVLSPAQDNYLKARQELSRRVQVYGENSPEYEKAEVFYKKWIEAVPTSERTQLDALYDSVALVNKDIFDFQVKAQLISADQAAQVERYENYIPLWKKSETADSGFYVPLSKWKKALRGEKNINILQSPENFESVVVSTSQYLNKALENAARNSQVLGIKEIIEGVDGLGFRINMNPETAQPIQDLSYTDLVRRYEVPQDVQKSIKANADTPARYKKAVEKILADNYVSQSVDEYFAARELFRDSSTSITKTEQQEIRKYTAQDGYTKPDGVGGETAAVNAITNALNKSTGQPGVYYHGVGLADNAMVRNLGVGEVWQLDDFFSTSRDIDVANKFAKNGASESGSPVVVKVTSAGGPGVSMDIEPYSAKPYEHEELFGRNATLTVTKPYNPATEIIEATITVPTSDLDLIPHLASDSGAYKTGMTLQEINAEFLNTMANSLEGMLQDAAKRQKRLKRPDSLQVGPTLSRTLQELKDVIETDIVQPSSVNNIIDGIMSTAMRYVPERELMMDWVKLNSQEYINEVTVSQEIVSGEAAYDIETGDIVRSKPEGAPVQLYLAGKKTTIYLDGSDDAHKQLAKEMADILNAPVSYQTKNWIAKVFSGAAHLKRTVRSVTDWARVLPNLSRDQLRAVASSGGDYIAADYWMKILAQASGLSDAQLKRVYADIDRLYAQNAGQTQRAIIRSSSDASFSEALRQAGAPSGPTYEAQSSRSWLGRTATSLRHQFDVITYDIKTKGIKGLGGIATAPGEIAEQYTRNRLSRGAYAARMVADLNTGKSWEEATRNAFDAGSWAGRTGTTSFGTKGAWTEMAAKYAPYAYASFSSRQSQIESFAANPFGVSVNTIAFMLGYTMSLASILSNEESRKKYLNLDDYTRENNILIPIDSGAIMTIPLDDELAGTVSMVRTLLEALATQSPLSFWAVVGAGLDMSSFDLSGFTEGDKFNLWRGLQVAASNYAPTGVTIAGELATGTNWYYGSQIAIDDDYLLARGITPDSAGDYTTTSNNSKTLHGLADVLNIPQWMLQYTLDTIGGNVGQYVLHALDKLQGATEESKDLGGKSFIDAMVKPFTGADASNINSQFYNGLNQLKQDKEKLLVKLQANKKEQTTATGTRLTELQQQHRQLIQNFAANAAEWVNQYLTIYEMTGGLTRSQAMQIYYLFDFGDSTEGVSFSVGTAGDYYANKLGTQEYYQQVSTGASLLDKYYDQSMSIYKAADGTFQPVASYGAKAMQNSQYNKGATYTAGLNALIQKSGLKDGLDEVYAARQKIYDKGKLSNADYKALDKLAEEWDAKVTAVVLPYFQQYGLDPLSSSQVIDYLDNYYIVPSSYMKNNKGYNISSSRLNKQRGFAKSYIQSVLTKLGVK